MLSARFYLGELRFGEIVNPTSHEPIIDPDSSPACRESRFRADARAKSERLLARLAILRCA